MANTTLQDIARDAIDSLEQKRLSLEEELKDTEAEIFNIKSKLDSVRLTLGNAEKRLLNFPMPSGAEYYCPICWIGDVSSQMIPLGSDSAFTNLFRCNTCLEEFEI